MAAIAVTIRKRRKALKLTQDGLAQLIKVSGKTISNWETQKETPRSHNIPRIIEVLNIPDDEAQRIFFGGSKDEMERRLASEVDPQELDEILNQVRDEVERDASLLTVLRDLIAGRRGRRANGQSDSKY